MEEQQQQQQHCKRYKGSQKEFYKWMVTEIDDFFPEIMTEDPLKKFEDKLNQISQTSIKSGSIHKKLVMSKNPKVRNSVQTLKYGPNFSISKYWKQFSRTFNENLVKFMDVKDINSLIYTCKDFKEIFDQDSIWKVLQARDFYGDSLQYLKGETKEGFSMKLYYKYLHLYRVSGIPYHTGYFKTYGSPDIAELSMAMVDFLCPKTEIIKKYVGEILMRNQCQTFDVKLSWLQDKGEICLWNGNSSIGFRKPETGNEEVEQVNEFYPCFIKRFSMADEDEEIVKVFFLEDRYLVVKLHRKDEMRIDQVKTEVKFRILDLEEEFHSMAKGLNPAVPFDYTFTSSRGNDKEDIEKVQADEFGVAFLIKQEGELKVKVQLLKDHQAVFFTEHSEKPTMLFWNLKEKKQIGSMVNIVLKKPLYNIMTSKKAESEKSLKVFIVDEGMNVYCGNFSKDEGFVIDQTILLPEEKSEKPNEEEGNQNVEMESQDHDTFKEIEAKFSLSFGKKTRIKNNRSMYYTHMFDYPPKYVKELDQNFIDKTQRYHHEIFERSCEGVKKKGEWIIIYKAKQFYFVNLDEEKLYEFSYDKEEVLVQLGNWTIYKDNLLITNDSNVLYYKLNFEEKSIRQVFGRGGYNLGVTRMAMQWILIDPCFTVLVFTHDRDLGFAMRVTVIVTSTQEFLCNQNNRFNPIHHKVQADGLIHVPDRWENKSRDVNIKFENSKIFVSSKKAGFFFDLTLSSQPYNKVYLNGWMTKDPINMIQFNNRTVKVEESAESGVEEVDRVAKTKFINHIELKGNPNTANAKEKNNGWKKSGGKSQAKKEEDKEYKVLKGKGEKYHKNVRQNGRSDKMI